MEYTQEDCKRDTKEHIDTARKFMWLFMDELSSRATCHDKSKLESPEIEIFTEYTPKLKDSTYGSDEYKEFLKGMGVALEHHYRMNSHHPEHFKKHVCIICFKEYKELPSHCEDCMNGTFTEESDISQMNLLDVVEMFCDWKAATMCHADGDIMKSIEHNQKRFKMSDQLTQILRNSVSFFG